VKTTNVAPHDSVTTHSHDGAIFISLEMGRANWLVTALLPGSEKMSRHEVPGGDAAELFALTARLKGKVAKRSGPDISVVAIQEAGTDGFWLHRMMLKEGIESYVVDATSIAVARKFRRTKTDAVDGMVLLRTLLAYKRGEPRVCSMVVTPSVEEEDRRRLSRERRNLVRERIRHSNRIKGFLIGHGIRGFNPLRLDRYERLEELRMPNGGELPPRIKAEIKRELDRLELVQRQIKDVCKERDSFMSAEAPASPAKTLVALKGIGEEIAATLWMEGLYRRFDNRRQLASYAGLAPSPWQSGDMQREQGISKSGNPRLRTCMVELCWLWLRHQPDSAVSKWFQDRVRGDSGRIRRVMICALARKLLIALWRYVSTGELPEGAKLKAA